MYELKLLSREAIPRALDRAERYRLLNEPGEAESICLDILRIDPENQKALVTLLLALSDGFEHFEVEVARARAVLPRLQDEYARSYYAGLIHERRAKAHFRRGGPGSGFVAYEGLREAMACYEKAEAILPAGNEEAILRWNTCARLLNDHPSIAPAPREVPEPSFE